jgi:hypothetical protein
MFRETKMHHGIPSLFSLCVDVNLNYIHLYNKLSMIILYCFQFTLTIFTQRSTKYLYKESELANDMQSSPTSMAQNVHDW